MQGFMRTKYKNRATNTRHLATNTRHLAKSYRRDLSGGQERKQSHGAFTEREVPEITDVLC